MSNVWKSLKILIVDDDSFQRTVVTKVLNLLGVIQVASVADGHAAELRLGEGWDLLILDLNMPGMDGIEFLNVLADHALNPALIFFSGEDLRLLEVAEDLARDLGIRVIGSISKPINRSKIEALLDRVELKTAPQPNRLRNSNYRKPKFGRVLLQTPFDWFISRKSMPSRWIWWALRRYFAGKRRMERCSGRGLWCRLQSALV